ncbi:hypothetical protein DCCM_0959 [Desulfocucumis palustris]|uniref:Uncharacterized protein n=1 Tax=Desulfocucumis palustris TaxID=1898651 RepID=A0A2L2XAS9_9FIRM|nr:hypothetical protein DCCM_0959 [Desulfocucumis palustris]
MKRREKDKGKTRGRFSCLAKTVEGMVPTTLCRMEPASPAAV